MDRFEAMAYVELEKFFSYVDKPPTGLLDAIAAALRAAATVPEGYVRVGTTDHKLLGTLPMTADGCVIGHPFCTVYAIHRRTGKVYNTTWYHRGFGKDVYSTREAAESARAAKGEGKKHG